MLNSDLLRMNGGIWLLFYTRLAIALLTAGSSNREATRRPAIIAARSWALRALLALVADAQQERRFEGCRSPLFSMPPGHRGRRACPSRTCPSRRRHLDGAAALLRGAVPHLLPFTPSVPSLIAPSRTPSRQTHSRGAMWRQRRSRLRSRPLWCRATPPPPPPQPERPATPRRSSSSQRQWSYSTWQCRRAMKAITQDYTTHI